MNFLKLTIVSPEKVLYEEESLDFITLTTASGETTILPNHIPIIARTIDGEIIISRKGKSESFFVAQGFVKVDKLGSVMVLSSYARHSDDIEIAKIEEAKKRAEEAMKKKITEEDFALAQAELARTIMELKVAQKRKSSRTNRV